MPDQKADYLVFRFYDAEQERQVQQAVSLYNVSRSSLSSNSFGREIISRMANAPEYSIDVAVKRMTWREYREFDKQHGIRL